MIVRTWRASADDERPYLMHFRRRVLPALRRIRGFRGVLVLRRSTDAATDIEVMTLWNSMRAIRRFAGEQPDRAIVETRAGAVLRRFDRRVRHFEMVLNATSARGRQDTKNGGQTNRTQRRKGTRTR